MPRFPHFSSPSPYYRRYDYEPNYNDEQPDYENVDDPFLFDLFGLKIYLDDVIIVALLLFLYQEGVQDEGLFIALILLLMS